MGQTCSAIQLQHQEYAQVTTQAIADLQANFQAQLAFNSTVQRQTHALEAKALASTSGASSSSLAPNGLYWGGSTRASAVVVPDSAASNPKRLRGQIPLPPVLDAGVAPCTCGHGISGRALCQIGSRRLSRMAPSANSGSFSHTLLGPSSPSPPGRRNASSRIGCGTSNRRWSCLRQTELSANTCLQLILLWQRARGASGRPQSCERLDCSAETA